MKSNQPVIVTKVIQISAAILGILSILVHSIPYGVSLAALILLGIGLIAERIVKRNQFAKMSPPEKKVRTSQGPIVSCSKLSMTFGKNCVLKDIELFAKPGELHCIIGPNGGGKSTLIKALLGQLHHEGTIAMEWAGEPGTIGYVPQIIEVDKTVPLTVEDFISLCVQKQPTFLGVDYDMRHYIDEVLKKVNMLDKKKLLFSELSGGERQRVLFAQALIPEPDILILDEPMNSIDRTGAEIFSSIIEELKAEGVTVIWVHHDLAEVREKADYVTCINREVIFQGVPQDVMDEKHLLEIFTAQPNMEVQ